ncbi:unnamed protein product [Closterium sp. NIES-53]
MQSRRRANAAGQRRASVAPAEQQRTSFAGIVAAALGASESGTLPGTAPAEALHTLTLDSSASRCFFRDSTTLTPLPAPVPVRLADPSGSPVVARSSTVLPCPAVPSGSLSGHHLPSFSTNLVSTAALQDAMVTTTTPGGQRVSICTCTRTGRHLATFTRRPGSSLYTNLLWHHRLGHPSQPRLRGMHSRLLDSGLPRSLPPLPPSPTPPCLPCVKGRQRAAPHSSSFPPTTAPLQTLHMDVWGPARVSGQGREHYFLLVVDDYTQYTTVFPLRSKGEVVDVLIPWIRTVHLQLRERLGQDLPVLRLHFDRGGEFSSNLLQDFCRGEGILKWFTLPDSPQQNGIAEHRIGLVMELNLWPRVSLPETSPTLRWTGEVGNASVFRVWDSRAFVRDTSADKLSARAIPCVFLGFVPDAPGWQFYHPTSRRVFPSEDVTFDESVPFYRLFSYRSAPPPPPPLFLAPGPPPVDPLPPQGPAPSVVSQVDLLPGTTPVQQLREWFARRLGNGATGAGDAEDAGAGGDGVTAGAGGAGVAATGPKGARTRGTGAAGAGGVEAAGAGDPTEPGATGAGGFGAGGARAAGAGAADLGAGGAGDTTRPRPYFVPLLQQVLGVPSSTSLSPPLLCPPPDQSQLPLQPASPLPARSPYIEQSGGLTEHHKPASRPVSPVRTARRVPCSRPPPVPGTHAMALRPSSVPLRVPLPAPPESSLPEAPDLAFDRARAASPTLLDFAAACRLDYATALVAESESASPPFVGGECALGTDVVEGRKEDFECLAAAVPRFASMLLAPEGDPDAPDIPTPRSYAEAVTGPYSSQWQAAMDVEMASWKSTGTYVDEVPPPGANIVDGMWIFRVKGPPGSPPAFKARYVAPGFSQRKGVDYFKTFSPTPKMTTLRVLLHVAAQRDYELHSLDFSTAVLQGSLHEEIWLRRPPGFTESFPAGSQWSLWRPVYGLRQAPREWHDTLRTTLAALGFALATADQSVFLRTDTSLPPFYVLIVVQDPSFSASASSSPRHSPLLCLPATHSQLHLQTSPTSGMGLVLGGRGPVVLTGHADASWVGDSATQRSSQGYTFSLGSGSVSWRSTRSSSVLNSICEAEIYVGAMAAQELCWLTYLLTDLGEQPRLPSVLYVDNKAMIALFQEHRLVHRTKHIALRYFLARELQQHGQLRLAYVAARANTADIFTKALPRGDHQRFSNVLGLLALLFLTGLVTTCSPPLCLKGPAEPCCRTEPRCPSPCTAPAATAASAASAAPAPAATMASPTVLTFDAEGRAVEFDVWVDDLQLFLQCDSRDGVSLFDHTSGVSTAPAATADSIVRSQWTTRDDVARLAVRSHLLWLL